WSSTAVVPTMLVCVTPDPATTSTTGVFADSWLNASSDAGPSPKSSQFRSAARSPAASIAWSDIVPSHVPSTAGRPGRYSPNVDISPTWMRPDGPIAPGSERAAVSVCSHVPSAYWTCTRII